MSGFYIYTLKERTEVFDLPFSATYGNTFYRSPSTWLNATARFLGAKVKHIRGVKPVGMMADTSFILILPDDVEWDIPEKFGDRVYRHYNDSTGVVWQNSWKKWVNWDSGINQYSDGTPYFGDSSKGVHVYYPSREEAEEIRVLCEELPEIPGDIRHYFTILWNKELSLAENLDIIRGEFYLKNADFFREGH